MKESHKAILFLATWAAVLTICIGSIFLTPVRSQPIVNVSFYQKAPAVSLSDLIDQVNSSVVQIKVESNSGIKWNGSGVIVDKDGLVLTAKHVLEDANEVEVYMSNGKTYKGIDWSVDPNNDIGILHIAPLIDLPISEFANSVQVGEQVFTIGSPYGYFNSVSVGIISAINRQSPYLDGGLYLQVDMAVNYGNSGGPVFNMNGKIIGIVVAKVPYSDGVGFIVPGGVCEKLLK